MVIVARHRLLTKAGAKKALTVTYSIASIIESHILLII